MIISVIVTSFNHEKYITQCLESVLSQKGDFQMEVIIGDDASTDDTRRIAAQFQAQHPDMIVMLPPEANLGITKNLKRCLDACTGDYIAICEGDDYWTDTYKLQKQKEFLDRHLDFSMCFSMFIILLEDKGTFELHREQLQLKHNFITTEDLIERNYIGNFSCCLYRREVVEQLPSKLFEMFTVDWMFNMACGQFGDIGFIRDWMSVYRKHIHGAWAGQSELENLEKMVHLIDRYDEYFEHKYKLLFMKKRALIEMDIARLKRNTDPVSQSIYANRGLRFVHFLRKLRDWLLPRGDH